MQLGISRAELAWVNQCQIYLQDTTLADLCDGLGKYILPDMWGGNKSNIHHRISMASTRKTSKKRWDSMATSTLTSLPGRPLATITAASG